jgi:hypothetical protein
MDLIESPAASADAAMDPTNGEFSPADGEAERRPRPLISRYA